MGTINKNLQMFFYNGADLTLAAAPWKSKVNKVFRITDAGTGWQSFVPTSNFNAVTKLLAGSFYFCDANTLPFDIDGAVVLLQQAPATPANVLPAVNAGNDVTLTLPTNQVVLLGNGSDSDGTITSYLWSQITGPAAAFLASPTSQNTTASGLTEGLYQFRLTTVDNQGGSNYDDVLITVNGPPIVVYTPDTAAHYSDNVRNITDGGFTKRSAFAQVSFTTDAEQFDVGLLSNFYGYPHLSTVGVFVNGFYKETLHITGFGSLEYHTVSGLLAGQKTVTLRDGGQDPSPSGTFVQNVRSLRPISFLPKVTPAVRYTVYGDSISIGEGVANPEVNGWTMIFRDLVQAQAGNQRVTIEGWGSRQLQDDFGPRQTGAQKQAFIELLAATFDGTTRNVFISNIGRNDFGLNTIGIPAADFGAMYAEFMDALHTRKPEVEIIAVTPIAAGNDNQAEEPWRQAIRNIAISRPWIQVVNGPDLMPADMLIDGVHPGPAGHRQIGRMVYDFARFGTPLRVYNTNQPGVQLTGGYSTEDGIRAPNTGDILYKGDSGNYSLSADASITVTPDVAFQTIRIWFPKVPFGGEQDVFVNGVKVGTFDTYKPFGEMYLSQFIYSFDSAAIRTIEVKVGNVRNSPDFFFDDIELF